jgi:hypothetical protein
VIGAPDNQRVTIAAHFRALAASIGTQGPIGELTKMLASETMDAGAFATLRKRHGVDGEEWFRKQIYDLFLDYLRVVVEGKPATAADLADIRRLRLFLRINDGDLLTHRPAELTELLNEQIEHILDDRVVTASEELLQVELQSALGIGYDDYLKLTRYGIEQVYSSLRMQALERGEGGALARQQLKAIEPVYLLATPNNRNVLPELE